ncbi:MAG: histidine kinase N-terminal 7TM domain-containing protein, partial [bacterium]
MFYLNLYNTPSLVSSILLLLLGIFVLMKNKKSLSNFLFFLICLCTISWQFSFFLLFNTSSESMANILVMLCYMGIILLPVLFLHFIVLFTKGPSGISRFDKYFLYFSYLSVIIFEILLFKTNYFIDGYHEYYWGFYPAAGITHPIFLFILIASVVRMIYLLYSKLKDRSIPGFRHYQFKYFLIALIFYSCSSIDFLGNYGVEFYSLGFGFILIFLGIIAYAIVSYRLMDIKLALRKSSVYLTSLLLTITPPVILKYVALRYFPQFSFWPDVILMIIAISIFPILRKHVYRFANKYLFSSLYDVKEVIANLSDKLSTTLEAKKIYSFVSKSLMGA